MKRKISEAVLEWKTHKNRMPLVLNGARQVGKTYILKQFGQENFDVVLYLNMEIETALGKFLDVNIAPDKIIQYLEVAKGVEIAAESTLLFFDEIQVSERALTEPLHRIALELFQQYFIVGGMPAAVSRFIETNSFIKVQQIQNAILHEYVADMAKYSDATTSIKIRACYQSIPAQLAKENAKFQFKVVHRGGTATIFGEAIEQLVFAGIVLNCQRLEHGNTPLNAYLDLVNFKLYMSDIGVLTLRSEIPLQMILSEMEIDNTFLGAMTENYVAKAFASKGQKLVYWQSEGKSEVDFVLQLNDKIIPIEVKKGIRNRSNSLGVFVQKYGSSYAIRISKKNFGFENGIKSVPLYAVFCI